MNYEHHEDSFVTVYLIRNDRIIDLIDRRTTDTQLEVNVVRRRVAFSI